MRFRNAVMGLVLLGGSQAFGAYFYELSTASPERLATYGGGGQFRGTLYEGATAATATQIGVFVSQCVDFLNTFPQSSLYQVSVNTLTQADMATTRWGSWDGPDGNSTPGEGTDFDTDSSRLAGADIYSALQRYMMAAWLMNQMQLYPASPTSTTNADRNAIQDVIWELMNPAGSSQNPPLFGDVSLVNYWWVQAQTRYSTSGTDYSQFRIITENPIRDTPGNGTTSYQEQIIRVPEPVDFTLAAALLAVFYLCRRRKAVQA